MTDTVENEDYGYQDASRPKLDTMTTDERLAYMELIANEIALTTRIYGPLEISAALNHIGQTLDLGIGTIDQTSLSYGLNYGVTTGRLQLSPDGTKIAA